MRLKLILLVPVTLFAVLACPMGMKSPPADEPLTVMTYNVYVGSDLLPLLGTTDPTQVPVKVAEVYQAIIASDFAARAAALARTIDEHDPHVVGLQEISVIRRESMPADSQTLPPNAPDVILDFLAIVKDALEAQGLRYQVAAQVTNSDIEMPMLTEEFTLDHARLTTHDVMLVRHDVAVSRTASANYETVLPLVQFGSGVEVRRGRVAADATVAGVTYRVLTTHLEAYPVGDSTVRVAQAAELVNVLGGETLPVVLMGDFNSAPGGAAYDVLTAAGFVDVWPASAGDGFTCCQSPDLMNEPSALDQRIDLIFVKNAELGEVRAETVGDEVADRLGSGQWPSDHAGVVARLSFE